MYGMGGSAAAVPCPAKSLYACQVTRIRADLPLIESMDDLRLYAEHWSEYKDADKPIDPQQLVKSIGDMSDTTRSQLRSGDSVPAPIMEAYLQYVLPASMPLCVNLNYCYVASVYTHADLCMTNPSIIHVDKLRDAFFRDRYRLFLFPAFDRDWFLLIVVPAVWSVWIVDPEPNAARRVQALHPLFTRNLRRLLHGWNGHIRGPVLRVRHDVDCLRGADRGVLTMVHIELLLCQPGVLHWNWGAKRVHDGRTDASGIDLVNLACQKLPKATTAVANAATITAFRDSLDRLLTEVLSKPDTQSVTFLVQGWVRFCQLRAPAGDAPPPPLRAAPAPPAKATKTAAKKGKKRRD